MSFLKKLFRRTSVEREPLSELGIRIINDARLEGRTKALEEFHREIRSAHYLSGCNADELIDQLSEKVIMLNELLHAISIPYGRAGDEGWYAQVVSGWSTIHAFMLDFISGIRNSKATALSKLANFHALKHFFETFYLKYLLEISGVSWREKDVTPSWSITVQQSQLMVASGFPSKPFGKEVSSQAAAYRERDEEEFSE